MPEKSRANSKAKFKIYPKIIEQVVKKYQKGCTVEETADMLEESPNLIKQIYDVIRQDTHDLDIENIYRVLLEKAVLSV